MNIPPEPVTGFCIFPRSATIARIFAAIFARSPPASSSICVKLAESMLRARTSTRISFPAIVEKSLSRRSVRSALRFEDAVGAVFAAHGRLSGSGADRFAGTRASGSAVRAAGPLEAAGSGGTAARRPATSGRRATVEDRGLRVSGQAPGFGRPGQPGRSGVSARREEEADRESEIAGAPRGHEGEEGRPRSAFEVADEAEGGDEEEGQDQPAKTGRTTSTLEPEEIPGAEEKSSVGREGGPQGDGEEPGGGEAAEGRQNRPEVGRGPRRARRSGARRGAWNVPAWWRATGARSDPGTPRRSEARRGPARGIDAETSRQTARAACASASPRIRNPPRSARTATGRSATDRHQTAGRDASRDSSREPRRGGRPFPPGTPMPRAWTPRSQKPHGVAPVRRVSRLSRAGGRPEWRERQPGEDGDREEAPGEAAEDHESRAVKPEPLGLRRGRESALGAGPLTGRPSESYRLPWQGQEKPPPSTGATRQRRCVQVRSRTIGAEAGPRTRSPS